MLDLAALGISVDSREAVTASSNLDKLAASGAGAERATDRMTSSFKRMGTALAGLAVIQQVSSQLIKATEVTRQFDKAISNLSAITGATGNDLKFLRDAAKEFGSTTSLSASQAAEAFKLMASAKPDLLDNAEALKVVTKEAITLAEAAGIDLPEAARTLGAALNQFGADASEASRYINVLAAGAKYGSSEIAQTALALKDSGVTAASMGVSFEQLNAAIQGLAAVEIKGGEAGTSLRNILLKLNTASEEQLRPSMVGLSAALSNLKALAEDDTKLMKRFGLENINAAKAIINQVDVIAELNEKLTGTGVAYEQARTNMNNLDGDLKSLNSAFEGLQIAIGELGTGTLREVTREVTKFISEVSKAENLADIIDSITLALELVAAIMAGKVVGALVAYAQGQLRAVTAVKARLTEEASLANAQLRRALAEKEAALSAVNVARAEYLVAKGTQAHMTALNALTAAQGRALGAAAAYNAALASNVSAARAASTATMLLARTATALRGAMAFLGGPLGVVMLAAWAIWEFSRRADTAKDRTMELAEETRRLEMAYSDLTETQTVARLTEVSIALEKQRDRLAEVKDALKEAAAVQVNPDAAVNFGNNYLPTTDSRAQNQVALNKLRNEEKAILEEIRALESDYTAGYERLEVLEELSAKQKEYEKELERVNNLPVDTTEADKLLKKFDSITEELDKQIALYGKTGQAAALRYEMEQGALKSLSQPKKDALEKRLEELELLEKEQKILEKGKEITQRNRTAQESMTDAVKEATEAYAAGAIGAETYLRELDRLRDSVDPTAQAFQDLAGSIYSSWEKLFQKGIRGFDDFVDELWGMFKDLLAKMAAQALAQPILIPMVQYAGNMMGVSQGAQNAVIQQLGGSVSGGSGNNGLSSTYSNLTSFTTGNSIGQGFATAGSYLPSWAGGPTAYNEVWATNAGIQGTGGTTGGAFSQAGTIPNWGYGLAAVGGYFGGQALFPDSQYAGTGGSIGATAGMAIGAQYGSWGGPIGAVIGAALGAALATLADRDPSVKLGNDADGNAPQWGGWQKNAQRDTPFGRVGLANWGTTGVKAKNYDPLLDAIKQADEAMAQFMTDGEIERVKESLDTWYRKGLDVSKSVEERLSIIIQNTDDAYGKLADVVGAGAEEMVNGFIAMRQTSLMVDDLTDALQGLFDVKEPFQAFKDQVDEMTSGVTTAVSELNAAVDTGALESIPEKLNEVIILVQQRYSMETTMATTLHNTLRGVTAAQLDFSNSLTDFAGTLLITADQMGAIGLSVDSFRDAALAAIGDLQNANTSEQAVSNIQPAMDALRRWADAAHTEIEKVAAAQLGMLDELSVAFDNFQFVRTAALREAIQLTNSWARLVGQTSGALASLKFSQANPQSSFARQSAIELDITGLQSQYAQSTGTQKASVGGELTSALQTRLSLAQQNYQRSDPEYLAIYNDTIKQLSAIEADAQAATANGLQLQEILNGLTSEGNALAREQIALLERLVYSGSARLEDMTGSQMDLIKDLIGVDRGVSLLADTSSLTMDQVTLLDAILGASYAGSDIMEAVRDILEGQTGEVAELDAKRQAIEAERAAAASAVDQQIYEQLLAIQASGVEGYASLIDLTQQQLDYLTQGVEYYEFMRTKEQEAIDLLTQILAAVAPEEIAEAVEVNPPIRATETNSAPRPAPNNATAALQGTYQGYVMGVSSQRSSAIYGAPGTSAYHDNLIRPSGNSSYGHGSYGIGSYGSHAEGLFRVPYDGYRAELHKGERVLTASQAGRYNATDGSGSEVSLSVPVNVVINGGPGGGSSEQVKQAVKSGVEQAVARMMPVIRQKLQRA